MPLTLDPPRRLGWSIYFWCVCVGNGGLEYVRQGFLKVILNLLLEGK